MRIIDLMSDKTMSLISVGTKVKIGGGISAEVSAICIRGIDRHITYEVTWWDGRERKQDWFEDNEISVVSCALETPVGFRD